MLSSSAPYRRPRATVVALFAALKLRRQHEKARTALEQSIGTGEVLDSSNTGALKVNGRWKILYEGAG